MESETSDQTGAETESYTKAFHMSKYSSVVSIVVGKENPVTFTVSKDLITSASKFFNAALNVSFIEAQSNTIKLPEDDTGLFSIIIEAVYTGNIVSENHAYRNLKRLEDIQLYVILDKYGFVDQAGKSMADEHLDDMMDLLFGDCAEFEVEIVAQVVANTLPGSPLREYAYVGIAEHIQINPDRIKDFQHHLERNPDLAIAVIKNLSETLFDERQ